MPYGWYSKKNLLRLWAGLRTGEAPGMTCHPTDKSNPLPESAKFVSNSVEVRECAGALLLIQRELKLFEADPKNYVKENAYRRGLTARGLAWWAMSRCTLAGTPLGGPPMTRINEDSDVARPLPEKTIAPKV